MSGKQAPKGTPGLGSYFATVPRDPSIQLLGKRKVEPNAQEAAEEPPGKKSKLSLGPKSKRRRKQHSAFNPKWLKSFLWLKFVADAPAEATVSRGVCPSIH